LPLTTIQNNSQEGGHDEQDTEAARIAGTNEYREYATAARRSTYFDRFRDLIPHIQSKLTPDEWRLIWYRWAEQMDFDEIAKLTGQPRDLVAYRTTKATAKARYWAGILLSHQ
jgi:hypothetical protein